MVHAKSRQEMFDWINDFWKACEKYQAQMDSITSPIMLQTFRAFE